MLYLARVRVCIAVFEHPMNMCSAVQKEIILYLAEVLIFFLEA